MSNKKNPIAYLQCLTSGYTSEYNCTNTMHRVDSLNAMILELIKSQIKIYGNVKKHLKAKKKPIKVNYDKKLVALETSKVITYEKYKDGLIGKEEFRTLKNEIDSKVIEIKTLQLNDKSSSIIKKIEQNESPFEEFIATKQLTREMVNAFISKIEYFSKDKIIVTMKYTDEIEIMQEYLNNGRQVVAHE